ncbi:hypothetical protein CYMTET_25303 [Cymbomonas tetramitiformis]|uniref:Uncharacterized protein n=1 Tax=Cymbomonas tetramitiformis TaxID=36881 RepID=A0AAE0FU26_9CHLO|nr:hypothetical protein CYMTET_25303 [Cymbomonas tetramitiformis]
MSQVRHISVPQSDVPGCGRALFLASGSDAAEKVFVDASHGCLSVERRVPVDLEGLSVTAWLFHRTLHTWSPDAPRTNPQHTMGKKQRRAKKKQESQ